MFERQSRAREIVHQDERVSEVSRERVSSFLEAGPCVGVGIRGLVIQDMPCISIYTVFQLGVELRLHDRPIYYAVFYSPAKVRILVVSGNTDHFTYESPSGQMNPQGHQPRLEKSICFSEPEIGYKSSTVFLPSYSRTKVLAGICFIRSRKLELQN
jgi:hypothetical protein